MGIELKTRALTKLNCKLFMDIVFLREGAFQNIGSGQLHVDGSDQSVFLPDNSADNTLFGLSDNQVWQSPFRQLVYESGIPLDGTNVTDPPIRMSGLLIEGAFRAPNDSVFGHTIDFINGRVIFDSPQSSDLKVNAAFAYRDVRIGFEHDFNQQFKNGFLESKFTTNPGTSNQIVYPSGLAQPFPAVFIEIDNRDFKGFELGNRSLIVKDKIKFHIWALDDMMRDNIFDIITAQMRKRIRLVDFNVAPLPLSGLFNTLNNEYVPYQVLATNPNLSTTVGSGNVVRELLDISKVTGRNLPAEQEFEKALVTFDMELILNAPVGPFPSLFDPIRNLPGLSQNYF